MLQHSISLPQKEEQVRQHRQMDEPFNGCFSPMQQSINLPDFQISQVIAKNQFIDIRCEEDKPFHNFLLRANELGYDAQFVSQQTIQLEDLPSIKYSFNEDNHVFHEIAFPSRTHSHQEFKVKPLKKVVGRKLQKIGEMLVELDIIRIHIWDYLSEIKQKLVQEFQNHAKKWSEMFIIFQNNFQELYEVEVAKRLKLEQQAREQINRIEQLQFSKQNISLHQIHWKQKIDELQEEIKQLNSHINNLSTQNSEIKYDLGRMAEYQAKISNYQNQIQNLNVNLQQNSEYIFDLEQKIANNSLELSEKEASCKKQYQMALLQERQKIQHNFTAQFEKVQEEIKQKVMEQLYHQYKLSIDNITKEHQIENEELKKELQQQKKDLQSLKSHYENEICHLQEQKMNLVEQVKEYQTKLHQFQQLQMKAKLKPKVEDQMKIQQLSMRIREIEERYRNKQAQLNYYKSMKNFGQDSIINCRPRKASNILVMDESILDKSILKESAISPSSALNQQNYGKSREVLINNILSRIKMRQEGSIVSQIHENSFQAKNNAASTLRPVSPESMLLEKEKDMRMKNISSKLEQLRSDIRRQIGMLKN